MGDPPIEALIERARGGCPESLGRALEACRAYLLRLAEDEVPAEIRPKGDVADLIQETFLEAARDFAQFAGRTEPEWRAWLRRIFFHNLQHLVRRYRGTSKRQVRREVSLEQVRGQRTADDGLQDDISTPSAQIIKKELGESVQKILGRLTDRDRRVLVLRIQDQCTFDQIGQKLGCSAVAARKAWHKALQRFREELERSESSGPG
jgi:RNA polymerase sigma-70 factor (ECF subfamily)